MKDQRLYWHYKPLMLLAAIQITCDTLGGFDKVSREQNIFLLSIVYEDKSHALESKIES